MYSLIIVDYNSLKETIQYILRCREFLGEKAASHIVVIDNGTTEHPLELLAEHFGESELLDYPGFSQAIHRFSKDGQQILYCHSGGNLGYAKGNNLGIKIAAQAWRDPYYLVSNNDLVFSQKLDLSVIDRIFEEDPQVGVIGPSVVTPGGEKQSPRYWQSARQRLFANRWTVVLSRYLGKKQHLRLCSKCNDTVQDAESGYCAWVSGCFVFLRAEAFRKAGMYDENTFLYAEEMILSKRMEAAGYKVYFCRETEVIHKHAESTRKALSVLRMTEIDYASNYYFYKTYTDTGKLTLLFCDASFRVFRFLCILKFRIKSFIKTIIKKAE